MRIRVIKQIKRIGIAMAAAAIITALAQLFYTQGGEIVAVPGILISGWIDLIAYEMSNPNEFSGVLSWQLCSAGFYFVVVYGLLLARSALMAERQNSFQSTGEI
jgi:hypothetical protein